MPNEKYFQDLYQRLLEVTDWDHRKTEELVQEEADLLYELYRRAWPRHRKAA